MTGHATQHSSIESTSITGNRSATKAALKGLSLRGNESEDGRKQEGGPVCFALSGGESSEHTLG